MKSIRQKKESSFKYFRYNYKNKNMIKESKTLYVNMEFSDNAEAIKVLRRMITDIRNNNKNHERKMHNGVLIEWGLSYPFRYDKYRIETINDQQVMILPSKLNDHE